MEKEEKVLFEVETNLNKEEIMKMASVFKKDLYKSYAIYSIFLNLVLTAIIGLTSGSILITLIFFIIYEVYLLIYFYINLEKSYYKSFEKSVKKGVSSFKGSSQFFEDYFIKKGTSISYNIKYSDIDRFIETDTNMYMYCKKIGIIIILQREKCSDDLVLFLEKKLNNVNEIYENRKNKKIKNADNINKLMNVLFVFSILSIFLGIWTTDYFTVNSFEFFRNLWILLCYLPIPLLSIILGFKYNNCGLKCTKNIVCGFIVGTLLFAFGISSFLMPKDFFGADYSKINDYRKYIDADIPENGTINQIVDLDSIDDSKSETDYIDVYYEKNESKVLEKSIINNDNWVLYKDMKSTLKIFMGPYNYYDEDTYVSIYNKTTNEYNSLPDKTGKYEFYVSVYDKKYKNLNINKFIYSYK
mgnify:CR=1 FL=1